MCKMILLIKKKKNDLGNLLAVRPEFITLIVRLVPHIYLQIDHADG